MKRIYIYFGVCFILLVYSLSQNTVNINKIKELEKKIKRLEESRINRGKSLPPVAANQAREDKPQQIKQNHIEQDAHQIALNGVTETNGTTAVHHQQRKESNNQNEQDIINRINSLIKRLKLNDAQVDEFWPIVIDFYEECQKTTESNRLKQLKDLILQELKAILSSQQLQEFEKSNLFR